MMLWKETQLFVGLINIFHWFTQKDFGRFSHWSFLSVLNNDELCKTEMLMEKVLQKSAKHYSKKLPSIFKKLQYKFKKALYRA